MQHVHKNHNRHFVLELMLSTSKETFLLFFAVLLCNAPSSCTTFSMAASLAKSVSVQSLPPDPVYYLFLGGILRRVLSSPLDISRQPEHWEPSCPPQHKDQWVGKFACHSMGVFLDPGQWAPYVDDILSVPCILSCSQCAQSVDPVLAVLALSEQSRTHLPTWQGVGQALQQEIDAGNLELLQTMYKEWPFLRVTIDLVQGALLKVHLTPRKTSM